jgi:hypothetical protein
MFIFNVQSTILSALYFFHTENFQQFFYMQQTTSLGCRFVQLLYCLVMVQSALNMYELVDFIIIL